MKGFNNYTWVNSPMGKLLEKLKPQSPGQKEMLEALTSKRYDIVGLFGPTGSGKSLFSVVYSIDAVLEGRYKKFILSRPVVDVVTGREVMAQELGEQYYEIAMNYLRDILEGYIEWAEIKKLIDEGKIVFADTHYLRGRTFDDAIIFLDDAQNIPPESSVEILMRIGRNSKFIIAGDPVFQKNPGVEKDGATMIREVLLGETTAKVVDLGIKDIVRPGARRGIKLLIEMRMRNRQLSNTEKEILDAARIHSPDADIVTVVEFVDAKRQFQIEAQNVPDALIIVKEGSLGRLVGRGGERIQRIEEDTNLKIRAVELTLRFEDIIRAIHPVGWIHKHIVDVDFEGPSLAVRIDSEGFGAFVGQRGFYVKFVDAVFRKLMGVGIRAYEEARPRRRGRER